MFGLDVIGSVLKAVVGPVGTIVEGWQKRKTAQVEADVATTQALTAAKIKHVETMDAAEVNWDAMAMQNSASSWKDEWLTIVLSIPLIMCFVPGMVDYVQAGFNALQNVPIWYQSAIGVMIAASFGIKKYSDMKWNLK